MMIRFSFLLLLSFLQSVVGQEDFQCGDIEAAQALNLTKDFDSISPEVSCKNYDSLLVPNTVHWHVYAIADGENARYSMFPENIVEPFVEGSVLKWTWKQELQGVNKGDRVKAAVTLYIPASKMKRINVNSVDQVVEIINTDASSAPESMIIRDGGVDNTLYISSPASKIQYKGSGVDTTLYLEAASGSSIDISGVDQTVRVKTVNDLKVKMSGVDQKVTIDASDSGDNIRIEMSGVDNTALVNGNAGCSDVSKSGLDNKCYESDEAVTVPELECLASTKVSRNSHCGVNWFSDNVAATAGISAVLIASIVLCVVLCCCCCIKREEQPTHDAGKDVRFGVEEAALDTKKDTSFEVQATAYAYSNKEVPFGEAEANANSRKEVPFGKAATGDGKEEILFAHAPVEAKIF